MPTFIGYFVSRRNQGKKGVGNQILQLSMLRYLDRFAEKAIINDESGKTFHFTMTGFKHRFGLKITKEGLSMAQIHQLIANVMDVRVPVTHVFDKAFSRRNNGSELVTKEFTLIHEN
ncbi:hypothetical protein D7Z26_02140 [Cohnella endophytica]|uniref:Uncharacterized protein n=1 Tax=Cohnella endophytica TaxID=2419778 RepID=A0A494Y3D8_9BACL|nr:hypothetical protein [Cohnella endophytica]RKP56811.1 hypothetical protein D7Z26_02140 [Cohnella endophytica]